MCGLPTRGGAVERTYNLSEMQEAQADILHDQERGKLPKRDYLAMGKAKAAKLTKAGIKNVEDAPYATN